MNATCKLKRGLTEKLRRLKQRLAARAATPLSSLFGSRVQNAFGILMYHRIAPCVAGVPTPTCNVTPRQFRTQLAGLLTRGYVPWPLRKVLEFSRTGQPIPRNVFVVTFDDGYENNYSRAWPILREFRIPATIFLATAFLDGERPFPFDEWSAAGSEHVAPDSWKPLSTRQCAEMHSDGLIELGTHTHTHQRFSGRPDDLHEELRLSQEVLQSRFGIIEAAFAFPFGIHGADLCRAAKQAGTLCSLTTASELVVAGSDPYRWGRFTASESDTAATLAAKLDGWYSLARDVWLSAKRGLPGQ